MLLFPQLSTGASAQYPIQRQLSQRTIRSTMEDGTTIAVADPAANYLRWRVAFQSLTDQEAASLVSFFTATQGNLLPFTFLDPTANLLLFSEDFSQSSWTKVGLTFDSAVADPFGASRASRVHNDTSISQAITQPTQVPGLAQTCFSVYLRASVSSVATLARTAGTHSQSVSVAVTSTWQRFYLSTSFPPAIDFSTFTVAVPPRSSVEIFGPQVDAQVSPSAYITGAGQSGVYPNTRFDMPRLDVIATGPNRHACVVYVRSNLPAGE